jgi:hypothetical protein
MSIMIKPNQTSSANVNVLAESDLTQVVGGCGHRRNYRPRRHHCWGWRRHGYGHEGGFQSRGSDDNFESDGPEFEDPSTSSGDTTDAGTPAL